MSGTLVPPEKEGDVENNLRQDPENLDMPSRPAMRHEQLQSLEEILEEAATSPNAEQSARLEAACGGDASFYKDSVSMLKDSGETNLLPAPIRKVRQPSESEDLSGKCFGVWLLEKSLGSGGMGSVWLASRNDGSYRKQVAFKLVHQHLATPQLIARFQRERQILADLEHPHIARLIDGGTTDDGRPYLVIEYVDGTTIERYCKQRELPIPECIRIFRKICSAVGHAHERGVIHRDLKPSNIMVTAAGEPKLLDFGIASLGKEETPLTNNGQMPMTPEYASPEQRRGGPLTFGCDIYALGLVLLELVSGYRPRELVGGPIAFLQQMQTSGGLPRDLTTLLFRALTNESGSHPYPVSAFLRDLDNLLQGQTRFTEQSGQPTLPLSTREPSIKTLLVSDLVNSTKLLETLGDEKSAQLLAAHDWLARTLISTHQGLEVDKTDGFLLLFERPIHALAYALAYHQGLEALGRERDITLEARIGIHLGEVVYRHNQPEDVAIGAKPIEVEGLAKPVTARLASLAVGRQTLMTQGPFELARRAAVGNAAFDGLDWLTHGTYQLKGVEKPLMVFEVGLPGFAPMTAPVDSEKAKRVDSTEKDQLDLDHPVGCRIGPYRIEKELLRTDWVITYLAKHDSGEFQMSVIIRLAGGTIDDERAQQFRSNRQLLADLRHPHIAMLLGAGSIGDNRPYFIMEYIDGQPIADWCAAHTPALSDLVRLFSKVVGAMGFAQQKGIFHGHINPNNLLVTPLGEPKLLGYAMYNPAAPALDAEAPPAVAEYAPPERQLGQAAFEIGDIYSLGLIFLQILTGDRPSEWQGTPIQRLGRLMAQGRRRALKTEGNAPQGTGPDAQATAPESNEDGAARLSEDREYVPELLGYVLRTALAAEPANRYPSAMAMAADLDRIERTLLFSSSAPTQADYDLVLWNHPEDRDDVRILAEQLTSKEGQKVWFDAWNVPLGDSPEDALVAALDTTRIVLICLGPHQRAPWNHNPVLVEALTLRAANRAIRILPVLLPGAAYPMKQSQLPAFLRGRTWATFPNGFEAGAIARLVQGIQGESPGQKGDVEAAICPFRGLEVFREEDQHFFFGRESLIQQMAQYLGDHAFLAVLGPSGSGKSSVVQAGLIPQMREQQHEVVLFTPGARPLEELAFALNALFKTRANTLNPPPTEELLARFRNAPESLHFIAREWIVEGNSQRILLVINQFEELFTLTEDPASRERFIKMICYAADQPTGVISVVLTMRSDFIGHCAPWSDLNTFISDHVVQVGPMTRDQLASAIEEPAHLAHLRLEPGLLDRILDDVGDASGALPLLQHALLELYEQRSGSLLTLEAYARIGEIQGALVRRAEAEYEVLDQQDRMTLRNMFVLCLVQPGEGAADTRRRATRQELLAVAKSPHAAEALLARWTSARLLTGAYDPVRGLDVVDVAHEALIQKWIRIDVWMQEGKATRLLLDRLRHQTVAWQEAGRHRDNLLFGLPLQQMEALSLQEGIHLGQLEQDYLGACVEAREQLAANLEAARQQELKLAKKRLRRTALVAGAFVVVVSFGAIFSIQARHRADLRRDQADDLIGFMLGDLKKKLDTVGRLDVLTDVGAKVRGYFETLPEHEIEGETLARQVSMLHLIGEVCVSQSNKSGALESFNQSLIKSQSLAQRAPERADWQNLLLVSHYWVATLAYKDKQLEQAEFHHAACLDIAERMSQLEPEDETWAKEVTYAHNNLGAVYQDQGQWQKALARYETSVALTEAICKRNPEDAGLKLDLADGLSWLAKLARDQADFELALSYYSRALALHQSLVAAEPGGVIAKSRLQTTYLRIAETRAFRGETEQVLPLFEEALAINRFLVDFDPKNNKWKEYLAYSELSLAEYYGNQLDWEKARLYVQKAASLSDEIGSELAAEQILKSRVHHIQAWVLMRTNSGQQALAHSLQAVTLMETQPHINFLIQSLNFLGKIYVSLGNLSQAQKVWERALGLAKARHERDFEVFSEKAMTYLNLGRQNEALELFETLHQLGFRDVFYWREVRDLTHQPISTAD